MVATSTWQYWKSVTKPHASEDPNEMSGKPAIRFKSASSWSLAVGGGAVLAASMPALTRKRPSITRPEEKRASATLSEREGGREVGSDGGKEGEREGGREGRRGYRVRKNAAGTVISAPGFNIDGEEEESECAAAVS